MMNERTHASSPAARSAGLSPEQLAGEQAQELPDREAMSLLDVGGISGPFPVPPGLEPGIPFDPSIPIPSPVGIPEGVDLTNVEGVGDISDVTDVRDIVNDGNTILSPGDLADLQVSADVTGASTDDSAAGPAGLMQPSPASSSTLA